MNVFSFLNREIMNRITIRIHVPCIVVEVRPKLIEGFLLKTCLKGLVGGDVNVKLFQISPFLEKRIRMPTALLASFDFYENLFHILSHFHGYKRFLCL